MELRVLGPIELRHDGSPITIRGTKPRQLLGLLAIRANHAVSADRLVEELWEGDPPPSAATALRMHIRRIREALELNRSANTPSSRLPASPHGYLLRVEPDELDAERFERLVMLARDASSDGAPSHAVPLLTQALDLWRGPVLADLRDLSAVQLEIARLEELRACAIEQLSDARLALGEHALVIDLLTDALNHYPLRERLTANLMTALYRSGRQADALRAYADLAHRLDESLGVPPAPELRRLEEDILLQRDRLAYDSGRSTRGEPRGAGAVRLVGRRAELGTLVRAYEAAALGERRLVLVSGTAGIGKTTLLETFSDRVSRQGVTVRHGSCDQEPVENYQPFAEILRRHVDDLDPDDRASLPDELDLVMQPSRARGPEHPEEDAESAQFRLFEAVGSTLAAGEPRPIVLVMDDMHWADRQTLMLLRHILRHGPFEGILVVAAYRSDEVSGARLELLADAGPRAQTDAVDVGGFDDNEVRAFVRAIAPPESMTVLLDLVSVLHDTTEGNPLFLRELLRELDEEPLKAEDADELERKFATIAPAGVRTLVGRRFERLTSEGGRVVEAAAVIGHDISVATLGAGTRLTDEQVLDGLEECLASRLIVEDPRTLDRYQFSHAVVRNAITAAIDPTTRRRIHKRVAAYLEKSAEPSTSAALAFHFCEAATLGVHDKAARYARAAGDDAAERFAFADAAGWYEQALALSGDGAEPADRGRVLLSLADAYENDHRRDDAHRTYLSAAESARQNNDSSLLAEAALGFEGPWSSGSAREPVALELLREALTGLNRDDTHRRVQVLNGIATGLYLSDPVSEGRAAAAAAELAEGSGDQVDLATARLAVHRWLTHAPHARAERLDTARSAHDLVRRTSHNALSLRIQREVLADLLENGEINAFNDELDNYEATAARTGSPRNMYWAMALRANQATMRGDLAAAEQLARGACMRGGELEQNSAGAYMLQRFVLRYQEDRLAEEIEGLRHVGDVPTVFRAGSALVAVACAETGDVARGLEIVRATLGDEETPLRHDVLWLGAVALLCGVAAGARDIETIDALAELLAPCRDHIVVFGTGAAVLGPSRLWLGLLAEGRGDAEEALAHLAEAERVASALAMPYWTAEAQIAIARTLRNSPGRQDQDRIDELITNASATARSHGFERVLREAARF